MKVLLVDDDEALLYFLATELEDRGFDIRQSHNGDEAFHRWQHEGPFEFVLTDHRFIPGVSIKHGVQLVTAIHGINPLQRMAIMTADPREAREKLPKALRNFPMLLKPFRIEQVLRLLREPIQPL
ncbi:MAG: response regulator [Terriglobales bacterium]